MSQSISPVSEWRKRSQGTPITLPSGLTIKMKPVQWDVVVMDGKIPDFLSPIVERIFEGGDITADDPKIKASLNGLSPLQLLANERKLKQLVAMSCIIYPKFVDREPESEDEVNIRDMEAGDLELVWTLASLPGPQLETFSSQQNTDVESVRGSENVVGTAKPIDGTEPLAGNNNGD